MWRCLRRSPQERIPIVTAQSHESSLPASTSPLARRARILPCTVPENIRLLPQLPGSPALNPTEPLWEDVHENETAKQHFDTLEHLETALCEGINRLAADPERLRSMTNFPYMQVSL
jgi:hypothetical protein